MTRNNCYLFSMLFVLAGVFSTKAYSQQCRHLFSAQKSASPQKLKSGVLPEHIFTLNKLFISLQDLQEPTLSIRKDIIQHFLKLNPQGEVHILLDTSFEKESTESGVLEILNSFLKKEDLARIQLITETTDSQILWTRDYAPIMMTDRNGKQKLVVAKYEIDKAEGTNVSPIQNAIVKKLKLKKESLSFYLEGGNVLSDANGNLYISTAVVDKNIKTPEEFEQKQGEIEKELQDKLDPSKVIWLPRLNPEFEITGHVDMYIKFLKENNALVAQSSLPALSKTLDQIAALLKKEGHTVHRVKIHDQLPNRYRSFKVFASYTNAIIINDSVIIPKFNVPEDRAAAEIYKSLGYKVVTVSGESIYFGGSVHCLTYLYP